MIREIVKRLLLHSSDQLEITVKKLRGAANRLTPETALTQIDCERQNWQNVRPCFVLSTGRTGTLLLNKLLLLSPNAFAVHQPKPELIRPSKKAYEEISQSPEIYREIFKSAREELLLEAARRNKVYIETNNRITFFAPIIRDVFPNAVFIHLVRHPGDFVRTGIRRNWYSGQHDHDIGRIVPSEGELKNQWDNLTLIERIGWLWNETNQFIEDFKNKLSAEEFFFVKSEELFSDPQVIERIFSFLNLNGFDIKAVNKLLKNPSNVQRKGSYPKYKDWTDEDKQRLQPTVPLAKKYGYTF